MPDLNELSIDNKLLIKDLEHILENSHGETWHHLYTVVELAKCGYYHLGRKDE
jgi:hypothetical protein